MGNDTHGLTRILEGRQLPALTAAEQEAAVQAVNAEAMAAHDVHADWAHRIAKAQLDQLASLHKAGVDLDLLPDLRTRTAECRPVQTPRRSVDLERCDAFAEVRPPYDLRSPVEPWFVDGPWGFKAAAAFADRDTGTMSLAAVVGNVPGLRFEGTRSWLFGPMNRATAALMHTIVLPTSPGISRPADYVVDFDIRAGEVASTAYLGCEPGSPATGNGVSWSLASVTGFVFLPNMQPARATRRFGTCFSFSGVDLDRIFTLRVTTRGAGNLPSVFVALSAEVRAAVSGHIEGAGVGHAEFRENNAPFHAMPCLAPLGGIEVRAIRVHRCPVQLTQIMP